jgi:hypothetical protein
MNDAWYVDKGKQRCGPFTFEQVKHLADSGLLLPDNMVWNKGAQKWVSAGGVEGLFPPEVIPATPPAEAPADNPLPEALPAPAPATGKEAFPAIRMVVVIHGPRSPRSCASRRIAL